MSLQYVHEGKFLTPLMDSFTDSKQRQFTCIYADRESDSPSEDRAPAKRRAVNTGDSSISGYVTTFLVFYYNPYAFIQPKYYPIYLALLILILSLGQNMIGL